MTASTLSIPGRLTLASPPLYITVPPKADVLRGDGTKVSAFFHERCRVTKESLGGRSGSLIKLRPWQTNLAAMVYARRPDERFRHRRALIGMPRKNGKSAFGSGFGLYGLLASGDGAEVYSCAADKDQARIVFGVAKRMVEMDEGLSEHIKPFRDVLEVPETGSTYRALSSEAFTKEGLNPSCVLFDEVHAQPNDELYDVMSNAFGARINPLMIMITTAGVKIDSSGNDSLCYRLYQYGQDIARGVAVDDTFFMAWWAANQGEDPGDPAVWEKSNPGYGDLLDAEDFEANYKQALAKGTINDFKTKRLNMWVDSSQAWLPDGWWDKCAVLADGDFTIPARGVVLGFDGSRSGDNTALVAVTVEHEPKVKVLGLWERPEGGDPDWRVPRGEVKDAIRDAINTMPVREFAYDEYLWQDAVDELSEEFHGLNPELFVAYPQTASRMSPATQRFYELVQNQKIRHNGDPRLSRHLGNAQIKTDERGARLVKDARKSARKIDLAIAALMAVDRAAYWLGEDAPGTYKGVPVSALRFVW
jgi:phage terminase large subunit-like protein